HAEVVRIQLRTQRGLVVQQGDERRIEIVRQAKRDRSPHHRWNGHVRRHRIDQVDPEFTRQSRDPLHVGDVLQAEIMGELGPSAARTVRAGSNGPALLTQIADQVSLTCIRPKDQRRAVLGIHQITPTIRSTSRSLPPPSTLACPAEDMATTREGSAHRATTRLTTSSARKLSSPPTKTAAPRSCQPSA